MTAIFWCFTQKCESYHISLCLFLRLCVVLLNVTNNTLGGELPPELVSLGNLGKLMLCRWETNERAVRCLFALYKQALSSLAFRCDEIGLEETLTTHSNPSIYHLFFRHLGCAIEQLHRSSPSWSLCRW